MTFDPIFLGYLAAMVVVAVISSLRGRK